MTLIVLMTIVFGVIILVFSAILHEVAHGYVAYRLGDPTAKLMGRLTLDPRKHIDPFLSIALPLLLILTGSPIIFGGAKPVPVDPYNFPDGRKDLAIVSLAGPLTNAILAVLAAGCIHGLNAIAPFVPGNMTTLLIFSFFRDLFFPLVATYNILLAIFNLLPIPPLDGSKIFSLLLPEREAAVYLSLGQIGIFLLLILLAFPIGGFSLGGVIANLYHLAAHLLGI